MKMKAIRANKKRKQEASAYPYLKSAGAVSFMVIGMTQLPLLANSLIIPAASVVSSFIEAARSLIQKYIPGALITTFTVATFLVNNSLQFLLYIFSYTFAVAYITFAYIGFRIIWPAQFFFRSLTTKPASIRAAPSFLNLAVLHWIIYFTFYLLLGVAIGLMIAFLIPKLVKTMHRVLKPYLSRYSCAICLETHHYFKTATIHYHQQSHVCKSCVRDYVQAKLREAGVSNTFVRCPLRNCSRPLTDFDLRHCSTDKKTLDTFIHFATLRFIHSFPCPKCPAQISVTAEQRKNFKSVVRCAQCKSSHLVEKLLSAPLPKNNGARLLLDLASKGGWQFCPGIGCGELVERIDGCNVMNHSKCGTHFCYLCGMKLNGYQTSHYTNGSFSPCVQKVSPAQLL